MSKVWLITGASRGLGRAFTEEALKAGHRVVATARNSGFGLFRSTSRTKRRPTTPSIPRFKPMVASTSSLTMPVTATFALSKIRRSRTSAHRLKRIYLASLL